MVHLPANDGAASVEPAAESVVRLGGETVLGVLDDVVDLRTLRHLLAEGVEAGAVAHLDGPAQCAGDEAAPHPDVDHT